MRVIELELEPVASRFTSISRSEKPFVVDGIDGAVFHDTPTASTRSRSTSSSARAITLAICLSRDHHAGPAQRLHSESVMGIAPATLTKANTLRQTLKAATAHLHRRLELQLRLLEPDLDLRRYRRILELFYGFYAPIDDVLIPLAPMFPFPLRARAVLLESDLSILGLTPDEIAALPCCTALPELSCCEEVAGCMYVLEGASLGGQAVTAVLRRRLGVSKDSGASFFAGDEDRTAARWVAVLEWLEGLQRTGAAPQPIVAAASAMFDALARWVDGQEPSWSREGPWST